MEDEIDIYADLPNFNLEDNESLAEKNKKITEKCARLENQVTELNQSLESIKTVNKNLEVNLSSLLKTAKAEIARKDKMIADLRRQLDNMQFRRGDHSKSVKPTHRDPSIRKTENVPTAKPQVVLEEPDTTEFVCDNPRPSTIGRDPNTVDKSHHLNGIVSTVFGERLRKKILEEEEQERKQKEQSKARSEPDVKKIPECVTRQEAAKNVSKSDSIKLDNKVNNHVKSVDDRYSLSSTNNPIPREDINLSKRNYSDRRRKSEDRDDPLRSKKKFKTDNGRSRDCVDSLHSSKSGQSGSKTSTEGNSESCAEILSSDDHAKFQIVDEYSASEENDSGNKSKSLDDDVQDRHNRVAMRLMLLAEGIDPDVEAKKSGENEHKAIIDDKKQIRIKSEVTKRSRSMSKNRCQFRSRSRTPDEHRKDKRRSRTPNKHRKERRRSRQRDDRSRQGRDRFERRRDAKNKDGDNLSEFSREIHELKERIEYRVDERSTHRVRKGESLIRNMRNGERFHRNGRSRTPDSSRSGSKERTTYRSRADKQFRRSRSWERRKSKNRGKCIVDDTLDEHSKTDIPKKEKPETVELIPTEVPSQTGENLDTKSLQSLEDGEIVDSTTPSPVKTVDPAQSSTTNILPSSCKVNLLDSEKLTSKINELKSSLPLQEIENNQNKENILPVEKPSSSIVETNHSPDFNDSLNCSKDERIENIAEFIANFNTGTSKCENTDKSRDEITCEAGSVGTQLNVVLLEQKTPEEIRPQTTNTDSENPSVGHPPEMPVTKNNNAVELKNINGDDHWCLIALDSPIKNFEENRKTRRLAQNVLMAEIPKPLNVEPTNEPLPKDSNDVSPMKVDSESEKGDSDQVSKPLIQATKNTSKAKSAVLRSLRSSYHKGKKEMILSDANSEQCAKIMTPTKTPNNEYDAVQQSEENIDKPVKIFENLNKRRSKSPVSINVDRNCNSFSHRDRKQKEKDLFGDLNDSDDIVNDEKNSIDDCACVTTSKKVDAVTVIEHSDEANFKSASKPKENNSKMRKESTTKVLGNSKSDVPDSSTKESRGKQTPVCKGDSFNPGKADTTKSIGPKIETSNKLENNHENQELNNSKRLESCSNPVTKTSSKNKLDGNNIKQKKEPRKLVVFARRRKPVHLEDSSTCSTIVMSLDPTTMNNT